MARMRASVAVKGLFPQPARSQQRWDPIKGAEWRGRRAELAEAMGSEEPFARRARKGGGFHKILRVVRFGVRDRGEELDALGWQLLAAHHKALQFVPSF